LNNQEKTVNEGLKEIYECRIYVDSKDPNIQESFPQYFNTLVENENESFAIDTFLFTTLAQFGIFLNEGRKEVNNIK